MPIINSVISGGGSGGQTIVERFLTIGSCTVDSNYIASSFSNSDYVRAPFLLSPSSNSWEVGTKIHTTSSISGSSAFISVEESFGITLGTYNAQRDMNVGNGSHWYSNYASVNWIDSTIATDTDYWYKFIFDGSKYSVQRSTDGTTFTEICYMNYSSTIASVTLCFGKGSGSLVQEVDLKQTYAKVNNTEVWRAVTITQA